MLWSTSSLSSNSAEYSPMVCSIIFLYIGLRLAASNLLVRLGEVNEVRYMYDMLESPGSSAWNGDDLHLLWYALPSVGDL